MKTQSDKNPVLANQWTLKQWMKIALDAGVAGVSRGEHPFGAAIFSSDGTELSVACNTVASTQNPSAHAEVNAIAEACQKLRQPDLAGCWLVATAEPCPMCLSTAAIAGLEYIAFGASQAVVEEAGYEGLGLSGRELASQFSSKLDLQGSVLGNDCVSFLLSNRKSNR